MVQTRKIDNIDTQDVLTFATECYANSYMNNKNLEAMKWDWCLSNGAWFATYKNDSIISLSGIHTFKDGYRALFRGAQLESRPAGLSKHHMTSYCFAEQLPLQIEFAKQAPIYITTNIDNDASGKMNKIDKLFHILEKQNIVVHESTEEVFYTKQNVWRLNVEKYNSIRF